MYQSVFIFLITACVNADISSKRGVYVSRKSRSYVSPLDTNNAYGLSDYPGLMTVYSNDASDYNSYSKHDYTPGMRDTMSDHVIEDKSSVFPNIAPTTYDIDYEKAKAEAKYDSHFLPSKIKTDAMYEQLKSIMHYKYPENSVVGDMSYDTMSNYRIDDDDVRSSSRSSYDGWPYFYHSPYDNEPNTADYEASKAKDKRYVSGIIKEIIPVYEHVDDYPNTHEAIHTTYGYDYEVGTDNPVYGDRPFFSFVLNDYFDRNENDDHLDFKGIDLDWGKDFDHETIMSEPDNLKRYPRLGHEDNLHDKRFLTDQTTHSYDVTKSKIFESSTEKGYNNKEKFDHHEKGDGKKENNRSAYEHSGNNYRGFKDIVDTFGNKFGSEDHKKQSKYAMKTNQDNGEKRRGFRRVYHKDEYQEDNEFYDNKNNTSKAEEKGGSALHIGGSEGVLQSHAIAALGNEANAYNKAGNAANNKFENNHSGHKFNNGYNNGINKYKDVARLAAQSNSADYLDHDHYKA